MKILVVDDELGIREFFSRELISEGYSVETASDGDDALSKLDTKTFDLVICDLKMPRLGGLEVLSEIRKRGLETQVILMTGCMMEDSSVEAIKKNADDLIQKPFYLDEILAIVKNSLTKSHLKKRGTRE
jgi:DNA-binding response OmpR family regulator